MSEYSSLKATINANVKTNGNQEITGSIMNSVLNAMVNSLGAGYQFMGVATPTNPATAQAPDYKCFYLATTPGTYTNMGGLVVADGEVAILKYDTSWTKEVTGIATAESVSQLDQYLYSKAFYDNPYTTAGGRVTNLLLKDNFSGLFSIKLVDVTKTLYISLYNGSTLLAEDIVVAETDGIFTFETALSFDRLGIYCTDTITVGITLFSGQHAETLNQELNKESCIIYLNRVPFEYGNLSSSGSETRDTDNVRSINYLSIPTGANKICYFKPEGFSYTLAIWFFDSSKTYISKNLEFNGTINVPNNARFYKILFYNTPTIQAVAGSNGVIEFLFNQYLDDEIRDLQEKVIGRTFNEENFSLQRGNIGPDGQDESTPNVRTSSGIYYQIFSAYGFITSCTNWDMAIFCYDDNKQFKNTIFVDRNIEDIEIDFLDYKYYRLVFYDKQGAFPTVADIVSDGFSVRFQSYIDGEIKNSYEIIRKVVSSDLDARKADDFGIIISKPKHILMRETGNIVWFGQQRLAQIPLNKECTPDPTVVKIGDWYYMACTYFPIKIYRSQDMVNWEFYRNVFPGISSDPFNDGSMAGDLFGMGVADLNYWAPSMFVIDNKVYLYIYTIAGNYSIAATQLVVADNIDSAFSWVGTVHENGVQNNEFRDTQFFQDTNGDVYISTGDGSSSAKRIAKMSNDLITVDGHSWVINRVVHEGTLLFKHNGWYYLFFSGGNTALTTYDVRCFRSQDITASDWEDCGTILAQTDADNPLNSTGHIGEIIADNDGKLYVYMHCHCYGLTPNDVHSYDNYGTRYLYCQQIIFDNNDYPHFVDENGQITTLPQWYMSCPNV